MNYNLKKLKSYRISVIVSTLLFLVIFCYSVNSQWQSDVRITNNPSSSYAPYYNNRCIYVSGNFIHITWMDNRDGNVEIYYKRSTDSGISWGNDTRITNNISNSFNPSIIGSGSNIIIVWDDSRDGNGEIYFKKSTNYGISWGSDIRLTDNSSWSTSPSVSYFNSVILVYWCDGRDLNGEIFYKRSTDNGNSWSSDMNLTNNAFEIGSGMPSVYGSGSFQYLVWSASYYGVYDIFFKYSSDNGFHWSDNIRLTTEQAESYNPVITSSGNYIHVTWFDKRDGYYQVYYKRSSNGGINWSQDIRLTNSYPESINPSIACNGNNVHIVWYDQRDNNTEIYYKYSIDNGSTWGSDIRLTNDPNNSSAPNIASYGSMAHIIWTDDRNGNDEIYYKRNPSANVVKITQMNTEIPENFSLSQNYPNPFNPTTHVGFRIADFGLVKITIYDALGREVQILVNQELHPGSYEADWDASAYPSGVYYYKLEINNPSTPLRVTETKKMVLIK